VNDTCHKSVTAIDFVHRGAEITIRNRNQQTLYHGDSSLHFWLRNQTNGEPGHFMVKRATHKESVILGNVALDDKPIFF
jgi:hypothetical protein